MEELSPLLSFDTVIKHPEDWVEHVCFDPKEKFMAICSCEHLYLWSVSTSPFAIGSMQGIGPSTSMSHFKSNHAEEVNSTAKGNAKFAINDSLLEKAEEVEGDLRLKKRFCHPESVWKSQFNSSVTFLYVVCGDGKIYVWDIDDSTIINDPETPCNDIRDPFQVINICSKTGPFGMGVSLTCDLLFTCDQDGMLKAHASSDGRLLTTIKAHSDVSDDVVVSPDGHQVATCSKDRTICLWVFEMSDDSPSPTNTPMGKSEYHSRPWPITRPRPISETDTTAVNARAPTYCYTLRREHRLIGHNHWVFSIVYSPDGVLLASVSADRLIGIWSTQTGELLYHLSGHTNLVWSAVFLPADENTGRIQTETEVEQTTVKENKELVINPDLILVSCSSDYSVHAWDLEKAEILETHGPLGREHCKLIIVSEYTNEQSDVILTTTKSEVESAIEAIEMPFGARVIMDTPSSDELTKVKFLGEGQTRVTVPPSGQDQLFCCAYSHGHSLLAVTSYSGNVFIAHVRK